MAMIGDYPVCTCPKMWHGIIPPPSCPSCRARMYYALTPINYATWTTITTSTRFPDSRVEALRPEEV